MKSFLPSLKTIPVFVPVIGLVACGGSSEKPQPIAENPQPELAIYYPDSVERGERFVVSIEESGDFTLKPGEQVYAEAIGEQRWAIVAPSGVGAADSIAIEVMDGSTNKATLKIAVDAPSLKQFEQLTRPYPFITSWLPSYEDGPADENGVPLFDYGTERGYFPIQISKVTQSLYNVIYQDKATQSQRELFIAMSDWLRDNCVYTDWGFCSWQTQINVAAYQLPDNWTSAMAQGQGISALVSAYSLTGDSSYLQVAYDALPAFNYPIEEKGVRADYDGVTWYEEYGSEIEPAHVLNGFLFGIAGVYDAYELLGSQTAKQIFDVGVESLTQRLDRYDLEFTSWYDDSSLKQVASMKGTIGDSYHELHIFQLLWTYVKSEQPELLEYADKFLQYDTRGIDSFGRFKPETQKILAVEASDVYADRFYPELLIDSNWTFRRYWAADDNPTTLKLQLNDAGNYGPINLKGIRLTGVEVSDFPDTMTLFSCADSPEMVEGTFAVKDRIGEPFEVLLDNYYRSNTVVVALDDVELPCSDLIIEMTPNAESGLIRFRELNLHFSQPKALDSIQAFYRTQFDE